MKLSAKVHYRSQNYKQAYKIIPQVNGRKCLLSANKPQDLDISSSNCSPWFTDCPESEGYTRESNVSSECKQNWSESPFSGGQLC